MANFFAYFKPTQRLDFRDILFLICCPAHLRKEVEQEREREKITPCEASSQIKMIPERDKAFVFVSGRISPSCSQDLENIYLWLVLYSTVLKKKIKCAELFFCFGVRFHCSSLSFGFKKSCEIFQLMHIQLLNVQSCIKCEFFRTASTNHQCKLYNNKSKAVDCSLT